MAYTSSKETLKPNFCYFVKIFPYTNEIKNAQHTIADATSKITFACLLHMQFN